VQQLFATSVAIQSCHVLFYQNIIFTIIEYSPSSADEFSCADCLIIVGK
jgi:hypothetical protein